MLGYYAMLCEITIDNVYGIEHAHNLMHEINPLSDKLTV